MAEDIVWEGLGLVPSLQILDKVHAMFVRALHDAEYLHHEEQLSNMAFFQSTLLQLNWALGNLKYSGKTLEKPPKVLPGRVERTLNEFDRLVLSTVRQHADSCGVPGTSKKLKILIAMPESESFRFFNFENLRDPCVQSDVREAAEKCIETLESLVTQPVEKCRRWSDCFYSTAELERRDIYAKNWNQLYDQLSAHVSSCHATEHQSDHQARVALETLGPCAPRLHLLFSTCGHKDSESVVGWQSVSFEHESAAHTQDTIATGPYVTQQQSTQEWCALLEISQLEKEYKTRSMTLAYGHASIRVLPRRSKGQNTPRYPVRPALAQLESLDAISYSGRKYLQCLLAHSLWLLYGTCWVFGMDTLESFSVANASDVDVFVAGPKFVHVAQCPLWTSGCSAPIPLRQSRPDADFMMRFGLLLLQIEYPNYLEILQVDEAALTEDTDLVGLLFDLIDDGSFRDRFGASAELQQVLDICLGWDDGNNMEPQYVLEEIFHPLLQELRARFCIEFTQGLHGHESLSSSLASNGPIDQLASGANISSSGARGVRLFDDIEEEASVHTGYARGYFQQWDTFHQKHNWTGPSNSRVRIAVLDTGISESTLRGRLDLIKKRRNALGCNAAACNPIKEKRSFVPGKPIEDACGHGTRVLNLLLRTAPDADYFVAKISDGMDDQDEGALDSVLHALQWAREMQVDFVNMSFGLPGGSNHDIRTVLDAAYAQGIKLFAAAGNDGLNSSSIAFPAKASQVFAIFASNGRGDWAGSINPPTESGPKWNTLGRGIPFESSGKTVCLSGTSYATPLAVGIVAGTFHFLRHYRSCTSTGKERKQKLIEFEDHAGVEVILRMVSGSHDSHYIAPWKLWGGDDTDDDIVSVLIHGLSHWR